MLRRGIREYFRLRPRGPQEVTAQVDEEIALHVELRTKELIAQGVAPDAARAEAEARFGSATSRTELHRRAERRERRLSVAEHLAGWRQDIAYSARALVREPLPAIVIVFTLGLGLGANATVFGIVDQLLLRGPAHVQAPEQVRRVYVTERGWDNVVNTRGTTGYITNTILGELTDVFSATAVYRYDGARIGDGDEAERITGGRATPSLFALLGVQPVLGRFFTEEEDRPGAAERVAVLEYGYWRANYGGATDVLGRTITLDGNDYTIIGVAPRGFTGPELRPARFWVPFSTGWEPTQEWTTTWNASWLQVVVRLREGVSEAQANERATVAFRSAREAAGRQVTDEMKLQLLPASYTNAGVEPPEIAVARWLAAVAIIVLLVACANVVNMLLARAVRRRNELAVRVALGVSRGRLVRLLLSESMLLAAAGGALALLIAWMAAGFLRTTLLPEVMWDRALNSRVLLFSAMLVLLTGVTVGLWPAMRAAFGDTSRLIRGGRAQSGARQSRLRPVLTAMQAAFALVLLVGAAHFVQSLWNVARMDLGVDAHRVLSVWTSYRTGDGLDARTMREAERQSLQQTVQRLRERSDVEAATVASSVPMSGGSMMVLLRVPGWDSVPSLPGGGPFVTGVSEGYFETVGTRIVRGRAIDARDTPEGDWVVVVNETMARTLWPDRDPLGECIYLQQGDRCSSVVGVAVDTRRSSLVEDPAMQYYVPLGQGGIGGGQILVRPAGDATAFIPELRAALHAYEPRLDHATVTLLRMTLDPQLRPWRLGATMFLVFGALALVIAGVGLYSIIAYGVASRRHEFGVRVALGARRASLIALIMREGVLVVAAGIAVGVPLVLLAGRRIDGLLFRTSTGDPTTFAAVAAVLLVIAIAATVVPALRAGRTSPLEAMRAE